MKFVTNEPGNCKTVRNAELSVDKIELRSENGDNLRGNKKF